MGLGVAGGRGSLQDPSEGAVGGLVELLLLSRIHYMQLKVIYLYM